MEQTQLLAASWVKRPALCAEEIGQLAVDQAAAGSFLEGDPLSVGANELAGLGVDKTALDSLGEAESGAGGRVCDSALLAELKVLFRALRAPRGSAERLGGGGDVRAGVPVAAAVVVAAVGCGGGAAAAVCLVVVAAAAAWVGCSGVFFARVVPVRFEGSTKKVKRRKLVFRVRSLFF